MLVDGGSGAALVHFQVFADLETAGPADLRVPLDFHAELLLGVEEDASFLLESSALDGGQTRHDASYLVLLASLYAVGHDGFRFE